MHFFFDKLPVAKTEQEMMILLPQNLKVGGLVLERAMGLGFRCAYYLQ